MPVDLRAALRGALDVAIPPFTAQDARARAAEQARGREGRRTRAMLTAAAFVASLAIVAGGYGTVVARPGSIAALPAPAPAPLAT